MLILIFIFQVFNFIGFLFLIYSIGTGHVYLRSDMEMLHQTVDEVHSIMKKGT